MLGQRLVAAKTLASAWLRSIPQLSRNSWVASIRQLVPKAKYLPWATMAVAFGMLLGRATGLIRELVIAARFGVSRDGDIASLAINVPDFLNLIFVAGAISAILIPEYHRLEKISEERAKRLIARFSIVVGGLSLLVTGMLWLIVDRFVSLLAPGFEGETRDIATRTLSIVLWAFPISTLTAIGTAALQARHSVTVPAFGVFVFNTVVIVGLLAAGGGSVLVVGWAIIAAVVVRWVWQVVACARNGISWVSSSSTSEDRLITGKLLVGYLQAAGAVIGSLGVPVIARALASYQEGGFASLSYATKLAEVPIGLFSAILFLVYFPRISRAIHDHDPRRLANCATTSTLIVYLGVVPVLVLFLAGSEVFTVVLLFRGRILPDQVAVVSDLAKVAFLGAPAVTMSGHVMGIFQARGDTRFPFLVCLVSLAAFFVLAWVGSSSVGLLGILTAVVSIQWLQCLTLWLSLRRIHGITPTGYLSPHHNWAVFVIALLACFTAWNVRLISSSGMAQLFMGCCIATGTAVALAWACRRALDTVLFDGERNSEVRHTEEFARAA